MKNHKDLVKTKAYWMANIQNDLYAIIDEYMKENGMNQTRLAEKLGYSKGYISRVLSGEFNHKLDKLVELTLAVGKVPVLEFQDVEEYQKDGEVSDRNNPGKSKKAS